MSNDSPAQTSPNDTTTGRAAVKRGWIAAVAVVAIAAGIITYKELNTRSGSTAGDVPTAGASGETTPSGTGSVILFADPEEAGSSCGCGVIIRLVRGASARGVPVREIAPGSDTAIEREYRVTVAPTVLFLDSSGHVVVRYEGEDHGTIEAIRTGLDRLAEAAR